MRKRKIKELITKDNLIIRIVSAMFGIMVLQQLGVLINAVFKIDKIIYKDAFIFGENVFLKENIFNILYVSAALAAVVLFILRKKSGWLLLTFCLVWHIGTLILFDLELLNEILYNTGFMMSETSDAEFEWSQSFPQFLAFASLKNTVLTLVDSSYLLKFISGLCVMLIAWAVQYALLWLICLPRIR
ncbi:MAG: hypothetical protein LBV47_00920, partial [Bacteroidales bacterium]|nr:hypothetical protein [Bacteroidales bacterium]